MNETERLLRRQAAWQRDRRSLTWPEKIRQAARLRATLEAFRDSGSPSPRNRRTDGPRCVSPLRHDETRCTGADAAGREPTAMLPFRTLTKTHEQERTCVRSRRSGPRENHLVLTPAAERRTRPCVLEARRSTGDGRVAR